MKEWQEIELLGRQRIVRKHKPREWITLFQKSGLSLQINPTYLEFRLWAFTPYGNVGIDLDAAKSRNILAALALQRFLISNVVSHGVRLSAPKQPYFRIRLSEGERRYFTRVFNRYVTGERTRKRLSKAQTRRDA